MKGFLLDEHVLLIVQEQLRRLEPALSVHVIGDEASPPKGTPDPDILVWIEEHDYMLITNNRSTMPPHLESHLGQGRHVPGIVQLPKLVSIGAIVADLLLIWSAALPGEFQDQIVYLPLRD